MGTVSTGDKIGWSVFCRFPVSVEPIEEEEKGEGEEGGGGGGEKKEGEGGEEKEEVG